MRNEEKKGGSSKGGRFPPAKEMIGCAQVHHGVTSTSFKDAPAFKAATHTAHLAVTGKIFSATLVLSDCHVPARLIDTECCRHMFLGGLRGKQSQTLHDPNLGQAKQSRHTWHTYMEDPLLFCWAHTHTHTQQSIPLRPPPLSSHPPWLLLTHLTHQALKGKEKFHYILLCHLTWKKENDEIEMSSNSIMKITVCPPLTRLK